jgi:hypothetical protein
MSEMALFLQEKKLAKLCPKQSQHDVQRAWITLFAAVCPRFADGTWAGTWTISLIVDLLNYNSFIGQFVWSSDVKWQQISSLIMSPF